MDDDTGVDVAELVKQHAELGAAIVKLGGTLEVPEGDVAKVETKKSIERVKLSKGKRPAFLEDDEEEADDMLDEGDDETKAGGKKVKKADKVEKTDDTDKVEKVEKTEDKIEKTEKTEKVEAAKVEKVADETIEFNGQTIAKSVVGDAQFSIIKSMTEQLSKATTDIAKAQDDALMARLEKRAGDEFSHVPGSVTERAAMLKAIGAMSDDLKKSFEAVFASSEALAKSAFGTIGSNGGDTDDIKKSKQDFEGKVNEIQKRDTVGRADALTKARKEHPDLFKAYQASN